mmetsp:Transcript_25726/g.82547  ORF Transcript_25726/g.82547 Transcript_25726/m.82547 type:complete len:219 (+) Transcript_25726:324-980(+)
MQRDGGHQDEAGGVRGGEDHEEGLVAEAGVAHDERDEVGQGHVPQRARELHRRHDWRRHEPVARQQRHDVRVERADADASADGGGPEHSLRGRVAEHEKGRGHLEDEARQQQALGRQRRRQRHSAQPAAREGAPVDSGQVGCLRRRHAHPRGSILVAPRAKRNLAPHAQREHHHQRANHDPRAAAAASASAPATLGVLGAGRARQASGGEGHTRCGEP